MNNCEFVGNLTKDPVIRTTQTGKAVVGFSIATNEQYITPQGEKKEIVSYINVVAWGPLAQAAATELRKGMRVLVQGRQSTRSYTGKDGQKKWTTEINANIIARPLSTQQAQQSQGYQQPQQPQAQNGGWNHFGQAEPQATDMFGQEIPF